MHNFKHRKCSKICFFEVFQSHMIGLCIRMIFFSSHFCIFNCCRFKCHYSNASFFPFLMVLFLVCVADVLHAWLLSSSSIHLDGCHIFLNCTNNMYKIFQYKSNRTNLVWRKIIMKLKYYIKRSLLQCHILHNYKQLSAHHLISIKSFALFDFYSKNFVAQKSELFHKKFKFWLKFALKLLNGSHFMHFGIVETLIVCWAPKFSAARRCFFPSRIFTAKRWIV